MMETPLDVLTGDGFEPVALEFDLGPDGRPICYDPGMRSPLAASGQRHPDGLGPFCRFRAPSAPASAGVYVFLVDGAVVYVGISANLRRRLNREYGRISPRNCFQGGPRTTCRINASLYQKADAGSRIDLLIKQTPNPQEAEGELIESFRPAWNLRRSIT
jgi:hypothetical protein